MKTPLLSVIIPAYNAGSSVSMIVSAVLAESFRDLELVIINDGSTDNTQKVLDALEQQDSRVIAIHKENGGPSSARNTGLDIARGRYVVFFDADDMIVPGVLQTVVDAMEQGDADLVVSGWQIDLPDVPGYKRVSPTPITVQGQSEIRAFVVRSIGIDGTLYNLWNKVFRADIIEKNKLRFRDDVRFGEDLIFAFHYFAHCESMTIIPDITYRYRAETEGSVVSSSSLSTNYRQINNEELLRFAGSKRDEELDDLTGWVMWRWLLSYYMRISASDLPYHEKIERIRMVSTETFSVARTAEHIGTKKLVLEHIAAVLRRSPLVALCAGWCIHILKLLLRTVKSFVKNR